MARSRIKSWLIAVTDVRVLTGVILLVDVALIFHFGMLLAGNCW